MNLLSSFKGGVCFFTGLFLIGFAGCSSVFRSENLYHSEIPLSNKLVAETVIEQALVNSGFPEGHGTEVVCKVNCQEKIDDLLEIIVPEFLLKHGYQIIKNKETVPEIIFGLDTLYVNLDTKHSKNMGKSVRRYSEARINAVFKEPSGIKKVYKGRGVYSDTFHFQMMESLKNEESFVNISPLHSSVLKNVKPLLFAVTITALAWFLYSYRG